MNGQSDTVRAVLLRGEDLVRVYDGRRVVDVDVVDVRSGEVLAILGPNGAGKSTLMRLLAALETPDEGRLLYRDRQVARDDPELRRAAVAVLQRPYLWRGTVSQNIEFGLKARRLPAPDRRERVREALAALDIAELAAAPVDSLSGGEAQRVALARALAVKPEILFLDEPTADLDVTVRRRLLADLERIVRHSAPAIAARIGKLQQSGCSPVSPRTSAVGQKADLCAPMSGFRSIASASPRRADPVLKARFRRLLAHS